MSTIRVVNIQHSDATEPNIVLEADGTAIFASGITISGGTNLTVSGTAEFASGTVSAPGITFIDDNNTGIYEPAADTVAITTAATERLRVDSSGRVGIGDSSPNTNLVVKGASNSLTNSVGNINVISTDSAAINAGGSIGLGGFYNGTSNSIPFANLHGKKENGTGNNAAGYFAISTRNASSGTAERMRIDSSGNVGIGISSPQTKFHSSGTTNGAQATFGVSNSGLKISTFQKTNNDAGVILDAQQATNGTLTFRTAGSERLRIDNVGNVGIGTTSPNNYSNFTTLTINNTTGGEIDFESNGTLVSEINSQASNGLTLITRTAVPIRFGTNGTGNRLVITSSGNVGIGTSGPISILHTSVNTPDGLGLYMENRADAGTDDKIGLAFVLRRSGGYAFHQTRIRAIKENAWTGTPSTINSALTFSTYSAESASERMRITSAGNVGIGVTNPSSYYTAGNDLVVGGTGSHGISIKTGATNQGILAFAKGTSGGSEQYAGYILYNHGTGSAEHMQFAVGAVELAAIENKGSGLIVNHVVPLAAGLAPV